jgi:hypothetical protein
MFQGLFSGPCICLHSALQYNMQFMQFGVVDLDAGLS